MRYCKIKPNDVVNGKGVCVSLWTQGCPHHCKGCFNKETWDFNEGKEFTGKDMQHIIELLTRDGVNRNLSILGGEPMCEQNIEGVVELCRVVKKYKEDVVIYVWTGYQFADLVAQYGMEIFENIDILIDGKYEESLADITLELRGSSNQNIWDIKEIF